VFCKKPNSHSSAKSPSHRSPPQSIRRRVSYMHELTINDRGGGGVHCILCHACTSFLFVVVARMYVYPESRVTKLCTRTVSIVVQSRINTEKNWAIVRHTTQTCFTDTSYYMNTKFRLGVLTSLLVLSSSLIMKQRKMCYRTSLFGPI
jgi:hypothetical protein